MAYPQGTPGGTARTPAPSGASGGLPAAGLTFFGIQVSGADPALYLIAWTVVTLFLMALASRSPEVALGLAGTVLLSVAIVTQGQGLPFAQPSASAAGGGGSGSNISALAQ